MAAAGALRAFDACGIELEYALVDRGSLDVAPIADRVLMRASGSSGPVNEWRRESLAWSNELVLHVLELKNVEPDADLVKLARRFQDEIVAVKQTLEPFGARLMPGGMHPWMVPSREARLWPHDHSHVYRAYDRVFDCRTHGWANLQAAHVNLPYRDDSEFARLHAALRVIIAIVPALTAASPYQEGRATGVLDQRMESYRRNADAVPLVNGEIIPEIASSAAEYERTVLKPLYRAIAPHDPEGLLRHDWLNARGVIARFDRRALEIRVPDTQECPAMDVGYAAVVMDLAQSLFERELRRPAPGAELPVRALSEIFLRCVHDADKARIDNPEFLALFGVRRSGGDAAALWSAIAERLERENAPHAAAWRAPVEFTLTRGPLARRLLRAVGPRPSHAALHELYDALCDALDAGKPFDP